MFLTKDELNIFIGITDKCLKFVGAEALPAIDAIRKGLRVLEDHEEVVVKTKESNSEQPKISDASNG